jgi:hypothetical protein
VQFVAANSAVAENAGAPHSISVQLNTAAALGADVTVQVVDLLSGTATQGAGNDYTYVSPTVVTFAAGSVNGATQSVNLNPLDPGGGHRDRQSATAKCHRTGNDSGHR